MVQVRVRVATNSYACEGHDNIGHSCVADIDGIRIAISG